jgi:2-amino-4-hydroxy-6-hydroxymethyldihydropteridine diphosphokinase
VSRAVLSLGSNLGDRTGHLAGALADLAPWTVAVSPVYETAPWGGVDQDDFLNLVVVAHDPVADDPHAWLERAWACERRAERVRAVRWGPRTLDVDVVDVDGLTRADPELVLPHPRAHERAFVLAPWRDVDPDAVLAGHGRVADLLAALPAEERDGVHRRDDVVLGTGDGAERSSTRGRRS